MNLQPASLFRHLSLGVVAVVVVVFAGCGGGGNPDETSRAMQEAGPTKQSLAASSAWTFCANEGQTCAFSGDAQVRYGADQSYVVKSVSGGTACTNAVFGDPLPGSAKQCLVSPATTTWTTCANEGQTCSFSGSAQVRYGTDGKYVTKTLSDGTPCTNVVFGDPAPGFGKQCAVSSDPAASPPAGPTAPTAWTACAVEGGNCAFSGSAQVRYGGNGQYVSKTLANGTPCTNAVFGDPAPGYGKSCDFAAVTSPGTPGPTAPTPTAPSAAAVQAVLDDVRLAGDARYHGVPSYYDWASGNPLIDGGTSPGNYKATTGWGQLYVPASGDGSVPNARVQLRNMRTYILKKSTHQWSLVQGPSDVEGAAFVEDFQNNASRGADVRDESANGGGISVSAGGGYNYHFWPKAGRVTIDPTDIECFFITVQARLVRNSPSDTLPLNPYVLNIGADYWADLTAPPAGFTNQRGVGGGRTKFVSPQWQNFSMATVSSAYKINSGITTMSESAFVANPPPLP